MCRLSLQAIHPCSIGSKGNPRRCSKLWHHGIVHDPPVVVIAGKRLPVTMSMRNVVPSLRCGRTAMRPTRLDASGAHSRTPGAAGSLNFTRIRERAPMPTAAVTDGRELPEPLRQWARKWG